MTGALLTAIKTFGRNDLRGTYRDPLLVMIVLAPVIWTVAVAVATPAVTDLLTERYNVDLVPYYPLVLTAFLLLAALRVTPVPLSTFFAYRAATVVLVTTVYVVSTLSFSGRLGPGLVPALIPIGLLAGLSAVVTLLLIVALANNKIQGIAMLRGLGLLIAGLPCLAWFVDSAWNQAFGVLPPYWAAKAFWVAGDHGTWWPYLLAGAVYNLAVGGLLFRRFLAGKS